MKRTFLYVFMTAFAIMAMVLTGCAASSTSAQNGSIEVRVTDAPSTQDVTGVMVTVTSVEIHQAGGNQQDESGWSPLKMSGSSTFDLLQIKGLEQVLATDDLAAGTYTQIRMGVSSVRVTFKSGETDDATVPSGKIKFVQSFEVAAGKTTVLLFDFDANHSINITGNGSVMFKPVIKLNVTKTPGTIEIITPSLPNGEVGVAYNAPLAAIGGKTPYTWNVSSGSLPSGLSLNAASGVISGSPDTAGDFTFSIKAVDSSTVQKSGTGSFTVNIATAGALQITTTNLPEGMKNVDYNNAVQAVGGTSPYTWSISGGSLPDGLTINAATGVISGTPSVTGDFTFTVKTIDSAGTPNTDTQNLTIHIDDEVSS